jgi:hypothetical protein
MMHEFFSGIARISNLIPYGSGKNYIAFPLANQDDNSQ